jgi:ATP-dependent DNA helicase RecQ
MVVDILRGSTNAKLISMGFNELTTYGIMKDVPAKIIRSEMDHLIAEGYLNLGDGEYPVVELSAASAKILKEKIPVSMKLPKERTVKEKKADGNIGVPAADEQLLAELKKLQ